LTAGRLFGQRFIHSIAQLPVTDHIATWSCYHIHLFVGVWHHQC